MNNMLDSVIHNSIIPSLIHLSQSIQYHSLPFQTNNPNNPKTHFHYPSAFITPCGPIANVASFSAKSGLSYTLLPLILHLLAYQIRCSPFPFLKNNRVVLACAMMFPPIGFFVSFTNYPSLLLAILTMAAAPGSAVT